MNTTTETNTCRSTASRALQVLMCVLLLSGCSALSGSQAVSQSIYVLDAKTAFRVAHAKRDIVLAIDTPSARPGFDTSQMTYVRKPHELNYFLTSRWADAPARMLGPLLVQAMEQTGGFRAVVPTPSAVPADVRLDTELIHLWQDFATRPSRVQLTLRAQLMDVRGQKVLAVKQFDDVENAASDDAYGGVVATNRILQRLLDRLADFCVTETVAQKTRP